MGDVLPLGKRVVVQAKAPEDMTPGGLVIPEQAQERTNQGRVVELGQVQLEGLEIGDTVLFAPRAGTRVGKTDLVVLKEEDLIAVLKA